MGATTRAADATRLVALGGIRVTGLAIAVGAAVVGVVFASVSIVGPEVWVFSSDGTGAGQLIALPLPLSDRNQGGLAEARALLLKGEASGHAAEMRLRTVVFGLHQELLHASVALDALDREILPRSEESLALARRGFAEGRFSYLELVDAQRTLGAVKKERIETAESYHALALELERLMGAELESGQPSAGVRDNRHRVRLGAVTLVARELDDDGVRKVGLKVDTLGTVLAQPRWLQRLLPRV